MSKNTIDELLDKYANDMSSMEGIIAMLIATLCSGKDARRVALMRYYTDFIDKVSMGKESKENKKTQFMVDMMISAMARQLNIIKDNEIARIRIKNKTKIGKEIEIGCSFEVMEMTQEQIKMIENHNNFSEHLDSPTGEKAMA